MKLWLMLGLTFCCGIGISRATVLSDAAAALLPGKWRMLYTINIQPVLGEPLYTSTDAASGGILGYADGGGWDPGSRQFLFIGSDHFHGTGYAKFVAYAESTNTWREMSRPSWFGPLTSTAMHGYDHNAINAEAGILYHRPFASGTIRRYDIKQGTWGTLPSNSNFASSAFGVVHFPEAGGLVAADVAGGAAYLYEESTQQWKTLATSLNNGGGGLHEVAEYNPVHKVVIFGGGNGTRVLYKIDADRTVTRMKDAPVSFSSSGGAGVLTVDPVSGDFLVFPADGTFYTYNVLTDTWTKQPGSNFFDPITGGAASVGHVWHVVAAPLAAYGVVSFVKFNFQYSALYLYKHADRASLEPRNLRRAEGGIRVSPNPAHSTIKILVPGKNGPALLRIYSARGALVQTLNAVAGNEINWEPGNLAKGIYIVQALINKNHYSKKVFIN